MRKSIGARTLPFPTPVWVVGSYDGQGTPNIATAAWAGICCSRPPCVYVSFRKATYSHGNIMARRAFSVNIPPQAYVRETDYVGIASGREVDKFAQCKLTAVASELVDAPYVGEFPVAYECNVVQIVELGSHTQFIGQVVDVHVDEIVLGADGMPDVTKAGTFVFAGDLRGSGYYALGHYLGQAFTIGKEI